MEKLYCTIFIVDISQNPEEVDTISSRIQQLIEDHGGIIKKVNPWGKQKLAYPIQNRNYGSYVEIEFTANSHLNIPKTIEQEYRINDRVLRYLTYVVTKEELQQREINAKRMKEEAPKEAEKESEQAKEEEKKEEKPQEVEATEAAEESEPVMAEEKKEEEQGEEQPQAEEKKEEPKPEQEPEEEKVTEDKKE